ncbi:unnamed protein product [Caenorhabditis auriculariae]|uniref:C2H2-type domain-containing protein n=1 Tax=Caenorhabditis auriculariae TaxID=2777116 RepID=A0A8S1HSW1_9PELO|nr:unnamed protein product [Caenorhabditis auriculariae]
MLMNERLDLFKKETIAQKTVHSTPEKEREEQSSCASSSSSETPAVYTLDALEDCDGRAKKTKKLSERSRCVCDQCGKSYATTSNLSRHKQTHRPLDSPHAKQCPHCDRVYVSMPALRDTFDRIQVKGRSAAPIVGKVSLTEATNASNAKIAAADSPYEPT